MNNDAHVCLTLPTAAHSNLQHAAQRLHTSSAGDCLRLASPTLSSGLGDWQASTSALRFLLASAAAAASSSTAAAAARSDSRCCCSVGGGSCSPGAAPAAPALAAPAAGTKGGRPSEPGITRCALPSTPSRRGFISPGWPWSLAAEAGAAPPPPPSLHTAALLASASRELLLITSVSSPNPRC
jgi:hypothetical protein